MLTVCMCGTRAHTFVAGPIHTPEAEGRASDLSQRVTGLDLGSPTPVLKGWASLQVPPGVSVFWAVL